MALTPAEEAGIRQLLGQSPQLLSLAGNESAIIQELGAQDVTIQDLQLASSLLPTDKILGRFGGDDKAALLSVLSEFLKTPQGLALGSAAYKDIGTGNGKIPDMTSFKSGSGWFSLPSGHIVQYGNNSAGLSGSEMSHKLPIPFPKQGLVIVCSYDLGGATPLPGGAKITTNADFSLSCSATSGAYIFRWIAIGE